MALRRKFLQRFLLGVIILAATSASQKDSRCERTCGSVKIPYPFGSRKDCYLDREFLISCRNNSGSTAKPVLGNGDIEVLDISLDGTLRISNKVASSCYDSQAPEVPISHMIPGSLRLSSQFRVSYANNMITAVGCGAFVYIRGFDGEKYYTTGCLSLCDSTGSNVVNGSCFGIGCCKTSIPNGATNYNLSVWSLLGIQDTDCGFGFIVAQDAFNFSSLDLTNLQGRKTLPLVLDWAVGRNKCEVAEKYTTTYACKAKNSRCYNSTNGPGYLCNCSSGYQGNPYVSDGCQDIDECINTPSPCKDPNQICTNLAGSYICSCREGYEEDRTTIGTICRAKGKQSRIYIIELGVGIAIIAVLVLSSWLFFVLKRRKFIELKEKYFQQNGGFILERLNKSERGSQETVKIFTAEELEKATKKYDESRIIGRGGFGIVYKGILSDNRIVAIKKSKIVDQKQAEQFINEVVVLSQINHRHIVKLLGCCLETQVPLLVYEFVPKGTLFQNIHQDSSISTLPWKIRLRIATETAEALWYLHSAASPPIIHRDVKSSNILLDDDFTAKVSDFGTSRLVPQDEKLLATVVQGTLGYLDPEYLQTNQLTEKSDVYSFGVVLVELLTGKNVLSSNRPEEERSLAAHFLSSLKTDRLFEILENLIVGEGNEEQIKEFVEIAKSCLEVKGEERPTMKEVAIRLDGLRKKEIKQVNVESHVEEVEHSLDHEHKNGGSSSADTAGYESTVSYGPLALGDGR